MSELLIGRKEEQAILQEAFTSPRAEMVAVFGRRGPAKMKKPLLMPLVTSLTECRGNDVTVCNPAIPGVVVPASKRPYISDISKLTSKIKP